MYLAEFLDWGQLRKIKAAAHPQWNVIEREATLIKGMRIEAGTHPSLINYVIVCVCCLKPKWPAAAALRPNKFMIQENVLERRALRVLRLELLIPVPLKQKRNRCLTVIYSSGGENSLHLYTSPARCSWSQAAAPIHIYVQTHTHSHNFCFG